MADYAVDAALRRLRDRLAALEVTAARERLQRSTAVSYDNSGSGLTADDVQDAIDELVAGGLGGGSGNLDGGTPSSIYGGTTAIDGGSP